MRLCDQMTIASTRRTHDGYMVTTARFARSGIYEYAGRDVGKPDMDVVRVYRPEDEVFNRDAMGSFAHRPITDDHPSDNVTANTWKGVAVGMSGGEVIRDGDFVAVPMMLTDAKTIEVVEGGKAELSAGYDCDLEFIDGTLQDGQKYDAVMRNIRGNHIAIVDRGRAGPECRIGDDKTEVTMQLKKIICDGYEVETTDAGATAIANLQAKLADTQGKLTAAETAHATALAAKDTELASKDATIADLQGKVMDAAAMDRLVADRAKLISDAHRLVADLDCTGKDAAAIRRAVVQAKCGDAAVADKSEAYVDARFDALLEAAANDGGVDTVRDHLLHSPNVGATPGTSRSVADLARAEQQARDESNDLNGWRTKAA